jgi:hypothetical protein
VSGAAVEGISRLVGDETPDTSTVGIALTGASIVVMPWLSVSTFTGLDAVAGFVIAGFAAMEGREAWEGEIACGDHD